MKVVLPKETNGDKKKFLPPLPLATEEVPELEPHRSSKFKLRTNPGQNDSPTYDFHMVELDGSESLRTALRFTRDILKVFAGLHITTDEAKHRLYEEMLTSEALNQYKNGVATAQDLAFEKVLKINPKGRSTSIVVPPGIGHFQPVFEIAPFAFPLFQYFERANLKRRDGVKGRQAMHQLFSKPE